jgi:hypothetical protein
MTRSSFLVCMSLPHDDLLLMLLLPHLHTEMMKLAFSIIHLVLLLHRQGEIGTLKNAKSESTSIEHFIS